MAGTGGVLAVTSFATPHAEQRYRERVGAEPPPIIWAEVVLDITDTVAGYRRAAHFVRGRKRGLEEWLVKMDGVRTRVLYDPVTAVIVTVFEAPDRGMRT